MRYCCSDSASLLVFLTGKAAIEPIAIRWAMKSMRKENQIVPNCVLLATAAFSFVAVADLPYGYYRLLRWIVCVVAIATAIQLHRGQRPGFAWFLGALAILFNPLVPVPLGKATWRIFDCVAGIVFLGVAHVARKDRTKYRPDDSNTPMRFTPFPNEIRIQMAAIHPRRLYSGGFFPSGNHMGLPTPALVGSGLDLGCRSYPTRYYRGLCGLACT